MAHQRAQHGELLWQRAAAYAAFKHRHQLRKNGRTPYFSHPARVAITLVHVFGCEDDAVIAAGFMHDLIEDTTTDYDDLRDQFGEDVADLVATMTKNMALPEKRREAEYDAQLARGDWRARLVKLADVYDNLSESLHQETEVVPIADPIGWAHRALVLARGDQSHEESARATRALQDLARRASARQSLRSEP